MNHPLKHPTHRARPSWRALLLLLAVTLVLVTISGYTFLSFREVIRDNTDQQLTVIAEPGAYLQQLAAIVSNPGIQFIDLRENRAGVWEYSYLALITGTPWVMSTKIDEREAQAVIDSLLWVVSLVMGIVLLLTYAIGFLLWRREHQRRELAAIASRHAVEERVAELNTAREAAARFDSDQRLGALIEQGLTGVAEIDRVGRFVRVNDHYARILGLPRETLLDQTLWDQLLPEDCPRLQGMLDRLCHGGPPEIFERTFRRPNGDLGYLSASVAALKDAAGACIGFIALVTDISERRYAEESMRFNEQRWKRALDGAGHAVWDWDIQAGTVDFSASWHELIGYQPGELSHYLTEWSERIHPDDRAETFALVQAHLDGRAERYESIHRMRHRDGRWVWILDRGLIFERAPDGTPTRMVGTHTDISALREAEENLRLAIESAHLGLWTWNVTTNRILSWGHFKAQFGLAPDAEPSYEEFMALLHPEDRAPTDRLVRRALDQHEDSYQAEYRVIQTGGSWRWISGLGQPVFSTEGQVECMSGITLDVTERKRMEQELRESERRFRELNANLARQIEASTAEARAASAAKSEFLAHMSHEIRTPLNAVLGLTQILARERLEAEQHTLVEHIQEAGQSLLALINDILDFSKIEAGQLRLESQPFDLSSILAKVDSLMLSTAQSRGLALSIETPDAPIGPLLGDAQRLDQVLLNLIGNAIKFTEHGGIRLHVQMLESSERQVRLRFEVSDSGIGIEPRTLAQLFHDFTQANNDITRRFGGTGLGLSISKRLVELMGGRIGVESQIGQGSTFWFELPFERAATDAIASPPVTLRSMIGPRLAGRHLLVVDDSAMNREVVERALGHEGARLTLAVDGQQALQTLTARPDGFDAVLMDVRMPVMDGLTATRLIRDDLGLTELPIIALTAGVTPEEQAAARAAGVDDILPKPLDLERLTEHLVVWIGARPLADDSAEPVTTFQSAARVDDRETPPDTPVVATASDHEALPDIPGIDRVLAARYLGADPAFFRRLLVRFVGEQHDAVERARHALDTGARDEATHTMHRLRGEAGHLGAVDLMQLAERLELAIEQGVSMSGLEPDLKVLEQRLMDFIALSGPWIMAAEFASTEYVPTAMPEVIPDLDPERLAELRAALSENNSRARRIFTALEPALRSRLGTASCQAVGVAIQDLRFGEALAVLDTLAGDSSQEIGSTRSAADTGVQTPEPARIQP
jgi:PAS domain S-box-containing protein